MTGEQLLETQQSTVFDALRQLRPQWLRARGVRTADGERLPVSVYIGGQRMGTVNFLNSLDPQAVSEIRFYTASEATTTFGTGNLGGVIAITRR